MTQRFSKMMSMNSNKRKGRMNPNNNKVGRSKFYSEKNMSCDGIYGNSKVMYAGASLVGCVVQVQVQNGTIYEGVLRTFSQQLDLVLEMAHKVKCDCPPAKGISSTVSNLISSFPFEGGLHDKIIFKLSDVIMMQACNVDVDYAIKDNFTDTAISKFNGQVKERELEPWEGAGSDTEMPVMLTMDDDDGTNGWDANDMFRTNAEKYGVKSSYDNSLQEYTVPLTKKDTEEYKLQEAKATKIAQEIETNSSYQSRIQLENGDEEDRFSAVVRTADDAPPSKYVLPQKRRHVPSLKRQTSTTTSSPVHVSSSVKSPSYPLTAQHVVPPNIPSCTVVHQPAGPFPATTAVVSSTCGTTVTPSSDTNNGTPEKISTPEEVHVLTESPPTSEAVSKLQVLPPRIERRRDNEKKLAKQKGRMDEIEDFKKFSKNFSVLTDEKETSDVASDTLGSKLERLKVDKEDDKSSNVVKFSTLNPNAKEFVFNPNAKSFTPRSVAHVLPVQQQQPPPPRHLPEQLQVLSQPLFTQYVMQAPLAGPFAQTTPPGVVPQPPRFRKAAGQALMAPTPSQLTVQYTSPPGVLHASAPPQTAVPYPQMNFVVGPRVVSPQPVGVIPTSHSVSYCDTSHLTTHHLIMSTTPHSLQQQQHQHHHQQQQQHHHQQQQQHQANQQHQNHHHHHHHHPPQSQTPVLHPAPSPVHSAHSQAPPQQQATALMYAGGGATLAQHPLQATHHPLHHHHHHHHPGFPSGGAQQLVLMQQQPQHHHHHHHPALHPLHASQNGGHLLSHQMALIPTSAAMTTVPGSISTPPYVQHP